ncbi:MAG: hypothetical protein ACI8TQ_001022 [Planctomycetota bacterium]|jgi:hypothetical protein
MKFSLKTVSLVGLLATLLSSAPTAQSGFKPGDLYLAQPAYYGISSGDGAILRIDPVTGTTSVFLDMPWGANDQDSIAYDSYRDRLIVRGGLTLFGNAENYLIDSLGNATSLGLSSTPGPTVGAFAPSSIGNIYFTAYTNNSSLYYYDTNDVQKILMDSTGVTPWLVPVSSGSLYHLLYHEPTNSLILTYAAGAAVSCAGGTSQAINIRRADLSLDGTRVLNVECFQYELNPGSFSGVPVGLSPGPGDDVIMTIDNNSNAALPRMVRIDPAALTATPFATNSNPFAAATNAGCYSHVLGKAVILDTFEDVLRTFSAGSVSAGGVLASGVSHPGGSGEIASLIEIGAVGSNQTMTANNEGISVSTGGTQDWSMDFGSAHANETYLVLGSATGWNPGTVVGDVNIPLFTDAYSIRVIQLANSPVFPMSFGTLDGQGQASSAMALGPGLPPELVGITLYHATVSFSSMGELNATTNAVTMTFL